MLVVIPNTDGTVRFYACAGKKGGPCVSVTSRELDRLSDKRAVVAFPFELAGGRILSGRTTEGPIDGRTFSFALDLDATGPSSSCFFSPDSTFTRDVLERLWKIGVRAERFIVHIPVVEEGGSGPYVVCRVLQGTERTELIFYCVKNKRLMYIRRVMLSDRNDWSSVKEQTFALLRKLCGLNAALLPRYLIQGRDTAFTDVSLAGWQCVAEPPPDLAADSYDITPAYVRSLTGRWKQSAGAMACAAAVLLCLFPFAAGRTARYVSLKQFSRTQGENGLHAGPLPLNNKEAERAERLFSMVDRHKRFPACLAASFGAAVLEGLRIASLEWDTVHVVIRGTGQVEQVKSFKTSMERSGLFESVSLESAVESGTQFTLRAVRTGGDDV